MRENRGGGVLEFLIEAGVMEPEVEADMSGKVFSKLVSGRGSTDFTILPLANQGVSKDDAR